jgi:hypothetical protein
MTDDNSPDTIASTTWGRYEFMRDNGHYDYIKKAHRCDNFFQGNQWSEEDKSFLAETKRPALTINKILATVSNVLGEQIFQRTDIEFRPRNSEASEEVADALSKVFKQISDNNQLPWVRSDVFCDGIITSRGFFDVRMDFTDSLRGEVRVEQLNPRSVLIDPDADSYDPDTWTDVIVTRWMSLPEIEVTYGKKYADKLRVRANQVLDNPHHVNDDMYRDRFGGPYENTYRADYYDQRDHRNVRVLERQVKRLDKFEFYVDINTGDMRPVPPSNTAEMTQDFLDRNPDITVVKRTAKRIRWVVVADDIVMHDDWSPYPFFTVVPYFPYFRRGSTIGLVENLIDPQELLNKASSQELHVINTSANSGWVTKVGNIKNMAPGELEERGAQTGLVLEVDDVSQTQKIQPNIIPQGLDRMTYKAAESIKEISGVSDYMTGFAREDVSAKSVIKNQQAGTSNLAKPMDSMQRTDWILAKNILTLIQMFYTEHRILHITTDRAMNRTEKMEVNKPDPATGRIINDLTLGEYGVVVTSQPERDTMEDNQFDQAVRLRLEAGVQIPDSYIIKASRLRDKEEIIRMIEGDKESPEAQEQAQLQKRAALAEVAEREAKAEKTKAEAHKITVEAEKESDPQAEMALKVRELEIQHELKRRELEMDHELEVQKASAEAELKKAQSITDRKQIMEKLAMERRESVAKLEIMRREADHKLDMMRRESEKPQEG